MLIEVAFAAAIDSTQCRDLVAGYPAEVPCPSQWLDAQATGSFSHDPRLLDGPPLYPVTLAMQFAPLSIDYEHQVDAMSDGVRLGGSRLLVGAYLLDDGHNGTWSLDLQTIGGPAFVNGAPRPLPSFDENSFTIFDENRGTEGCRYGCLFSGHVTSLARVPEPTTPILCAIGFAWIITLRRWWRGVA
jgi:hypothetical protein